MKSLKPAIALYAIIVGVFIFGVIHITTSKKFEVNHHPKIEQTVSADGRYVAGDDEWYEVGISPALAWKEGKGKEWRVASIVVLVALGIFIFLAAIDIIIIKGAEGNYVLFPGMIIAALMMWAAYSSTYSSNRIGISPQHYEQVKDSKEKLSELFTSKELVR